MFCLYRKITLFLCLIVSGCDPNLSDDPIPVVPFNDIFIQLNLPQYSSLGTMGYYELNGGVRGIILYRKDASTIIAYERNCSYHPNEACATVNVDLSGLFMVDPCCGSTFDFANGNPTSGIAWRPLRRYRTYIANGGLTITDEALN